VHGGDSPQKLEALRVQLTAEPDLSLVERAERLRQQHGIVVSGPTLLARASRGPRAESKKSA
jgi:hypothetical protein